MHALNIVQQLIRSCCPRLHAARLSVLLAAVGAAVRARRLTLTELGRALIGTAHPKHDIKRIDRLLGNHHLAAERFELYQVLARRVVGALREPLIVIDWSDLTPDRRWQLLRAAMPIGGRCLTLYEQHRLSRPARHCSHFQQLSPGETKTRCPTVTLSTCEPTCSTIPDTSDPDT